MRMLCATLALLTAACAGADRAAGPEARNEVDGSGGVVQLRNGQLTLDFPPGAVSEPIRVGVRQLEDPPEAPGLLPGAVFALQPAGVRFSRPVELTIRYHEEEVPTGASEESLEVYRMTKGSWVLSGESSVVPELNRIRSSIGGLDTVAVVSDHPCVQVEEFRMGDRVAGELSSTDCSIWDGRVIDKFGLSFPDQTAFRVRVSSEDFTGSVYTTRVAEGVDRVLDAKVGSIIHIVPAGRYQFWPTSLESEATTGSPVLGRYGLTADFVEGDPTGGCGGEVTVANGVTVEGSITVDDCEETRDGDPDVVRRADHYILNVDRPEMATVTLTADFPFNLIAWGGGTPVAGAFGREPGTTATVTVDPPRITRVRFSVVSDEEGATGSYTITFGIGPREG